MYIYTYYRQSCDREYVTEEEFGAVLPLPLPLFSSPGRP